MPPAAPSTLPPRVVVPRCGACDNLANWRIGLLGRKPAFEPSRGRHFLPVSIRLEPLVMGFALVCVSALRHGAVAPSIARGLHVVARGHCERSRSARGVWASFSGETIDLQDFDLLHGHHGHHGQLAIDYKATAAYTRNVSATLVGEQVFGASVFRRRPLSFYARWPRTLLS